MGLSVVFRILTGVSTVKKCAVLPVSAMHMFGDVGAGGPTTLLHECKVGGVVTCKSVSILLDPLGLRVTTSLFFSLALLLFVGFPRRQFSFWSPS